MANIVSGVTAGGRSWWKHREAPTWLVAIGVYAGWLMLTWYAALTPWWLLIPLAGYLLCLYGSLQHEIVHGHPTRTRWINTLLGWPPLSLWLPLDLYRDTHLRHHRATQLTCPIEDPESFYVTAQEWARLGPLARGLLRCNGTLLGRLLLGPLIVVGQFWRAELNRLLRGNLKHLRTWLSHAAGCGLVIAWVVGVCDIALSHYLLFFVWPGLSLTLLRSYAEHRPAPEQAQRSAIVDASAPMHLLYLNNNYHAMHHRQPTLAWYELPAAYRANREEILRDNGGYRYTGYAELLLRFMVRGSGTPTHPDSEATERTADQAALRSAPPGAGG